MTGQDNIFAVFPGRLRRGLEQAGLDTELLQEIRLRAGRPVLLRYDGRELGISEATQRPELMEPAKEALRMLVATRQEIEETLEYLSGYSLYAFDEELRQGYFTIPGGHRVGVAGKAVAEGRLIQCIRHISFVNVRFSHERKGCADALMPYLIEDGTVCHTLILSPPGCGKTTLLRDVIRQLSDGVRELTELQARDMSKKQSVCESGDFDKPEFAGVTVGVVDERSELAGCYLGIPQNDIGMRTDVLDCCPKAEGMRMLLRSMAPRVIAVDEIGGSEDGEAIEAVFHCGCKLIATAHGSSIEDAVRRPVLKKLIDEQLFERYVVLGRWERPGELRAVFDGNGERLR